MSTGNVSSLWAAFCPVGSPTNARTPDRKTTARQAVRACGSCCWTCTTDTAAVGRAMSVHGTRISPISPTFVLWRDWGLAGSRVNSERQAQESKPNSILLFLPPVRQPIRVRLRVRPNARLLFREPRKPEGTNHSEYMSRVSPPCSTSSGSGGRRTLGLANRPEAYRDHRRTVDVSQATVPPGSNSSA